MSQILQGVRKMLEILTHMLENVVNSFEHGRTFQAGDACAARALPARRAASRLGRAVRAARAAHSAAGGVDSVRAAALTSSR